MQEVGCPDVGGSPEADERKTTQKLVTARSHKGWRWRRRWWNQTLGVEPPGTSAAY